MHAQKYRSEAKVKPKSQLDQP